MNAIPPLQDIELVPIRHLKKGADDFWCATGNDPGFECRLPVARLPAGWYEVEIEIAQESGSPMCAYLYPDYGEQIQEANRLFLPFVQAGQRVHRGVILLVRDTLALRFDPSISPFEFRLGVMRITPIGRRRAAIDMAEHLFARTQTRVRDFGSIVAGFAKGGFRGLGDALYHTYSRQPSISFSAPYQTWLDLYDQHSPRAMGLARAKAEALLGDGAVKFSVLMPVYNTPEKWLRKAIDSVLNQAYPSWELCIANDASPAPHVRRVLDEYARRDPRIKVTHRSQNGHISASSNTAADAATGEWMVLLDHDDELHSLALLELAEGIGRNPRWRVVYTDEDKVDGEGRRYDPYMKSDWNYDLFLSHNCISHLGAYHATLFRDIGGFRVGLEGSQDWDLALRAIERIDHHQVGHIPKVLYHWRAIEGSTALAPQEKDYAHDAGLRAVQEHLDRLAEGAVAKGIPGLRGNYRVVYPVPAPAPLVSIIIPTRDGVDLLRACIESVFEHTTYPNFEIVVMDNQSGDEATLAYFQELTGAGSARVIRYDEPFNYARINNAAVPAARGDVLCFLNNDITVITPGWLEEMVGHACRSNVGAVGAMLYYPNNTIQHAGVMVGVHGVAAHVYSGHGRGYPGHMGRARLTQTLSAVTAACLVVQREKFVLIDGFDTALKVAFNDVDLCLRLDQRGLRNVWTPFAELHHHESASRGLEDSPEKLARFHGEVKFMVERWGDRLRVDPYYSPNFTLDEEPCQLAFPPRWEWAFGSES
ncbi:glycosyltransferase family 2 protein [Luteimonas sp. SMYT11W]|uniref:Glycosyltransferase family 2 protein n=2 Tax=Luteimonas flava TaxID=3115822 RepID=A0ABU7WH78_9GAMM